MDDVIVVGGGTAGCVVAARLSEDPGRTVRLLEAGTVPRHPEDVPPELRSATSLAGSVPGHPATWSFPGELTPGRPFTVPRGRILGGSSAVNGAYFTRTTPADHATWAAQGNPAWTYDALLPYYRTSETDHDYPGPPPGTPVPGTLGPGGPIPGGPVPGDPGPRGSGHGTLAPGVPVHGSAGPMPVARPSGDLLGPAPAAFLAACRALGHPDEPDRNGGGTPGAGPVPANTRDGLRVGTAAAYLPAAVRAARANLTVTGDAVVHRVLIERGRAAGVEAAIGGVRTVLRAGRVVLCAGAINTAHLLLLSGIGPAADLRHHGVPVVRDAPVGTAFTDHPQLWLTYRTAAPFPVRPGMILTQAALDTPDAEYLATGVPMPVALGATAGVAPAELALVIELPRPESRGRLGLTAPGAPPRLAYGYLEPAADRARLRAAVRHGLEILRTPPLRDEVGAVLAPAPSDTATDRDLDAWIRANLQTAFHLSGTAPMGPATTTAVTGQDGSVHGVPGLHVADTSVVPVPLSRGPAATAVLIGERVAAFLR